MRPGWRRGGAVATWLVLAAVGLVAAIATLDALRPARSPPSTESAESAARLAGRLLPQPGALPGTLVFTSLAGCRTRALSLERLTVGRPGPSLACGLWVSSGDLAAVSLAPALGLRGSVLGLLRLGEPPALVRRLGVARGEPSWSEDGERLAWCAEDDDTVVLGVRSGTRTRVAGCRPSIAPDGSVLTRPQRPLAPVLLRDGRLELGEDELAQGFPAGSDGPLDLVGYAARRDGLLAVVAVRFESGRRPRRVLELWRDGRLEDVVALPELGLPGGYGRFGERVEFDPTGTELAVGFPGAGKQIVLVDLQSLGIVLPPTFQHGFAWSPDGAWFAVSTGEEVRVLDRARGEPVYVLPVGAAAIAWRP